MDLIPGRILGRPHGGGHGNSLLYSYLENPIDRGTWWATVRRVAKSGKRLKQLCMHAHRNNLYYIHVCMYVYIYMYIVQHIYVCVCVLVAQSCLILCNPMNCSLPGSSVHGILQARILQWVIVLFSRGSSWPKNRTQVSRIAGGFFTIWAT